MIGALVAEGGRVDLFGAFGGRRCLIFVGCVLSFICTVSLGEKRSVLTWCK